MLRIPFAAFFLRRFARLLPVLVCLHLASPLIAAETTPDSVPCPACRGTALCAAPGCKEGKTLCPATCIKRESPGWHKKKLDNFPDDYLWLDFKFTDGSGRTQYISDRHIGELVAYENGAPVPRGVCPTCQGSAHVACATCKGDKSCTVCAGAGRFVRDQTLFTLTDSQGRPLEAVIRSRQADSVTVLRLADQRVFDIPLAKLSPESTELIERHFPAKN